MFHGAEKTQEWAENKTSLVEAVYLLLNFNEFGSKS